MVVKTALSFQESVPGGGANHEGLNGLRECIFGLTPRGICQSWTNLRYKQIEKALKLQRNPRPVVYVEQPQAQNELTIWMNLRNLRACRRVEAYHDKDMQK